MSKKILSLLLAVVMVALAIPAAVLPAFAAEENKASANTGFSLLENFPMTGRETWATTKATKDLITNNNGAWQAGIYDVTFDASKVAVGKMTDSVVISNTFTAYDAINTTYTTNSEIFVEASGKGGSFLSRALYLNKDSNREGGWGVYLTTGLDYGWSSSGCPIEAYEYAPAIRYTAEQAGDVVVTLDGGWYNDYAEGYQHLFVRHNGVIVKDIVHENADVLVTIELSLNVGDTVEFVSAMDPILTKEYSYLDETAAAKWATFKEGAGIARARRGFRIDDIDIQLVGAKSQITSDFSVNENFILNGLDSYSTSNLPTFSNDGAWQAGLLNATLDKTAIAADADLDAYLTVGNSFMAFNQLVETKSTYFFISRADYTGGNMHSRDIYMAKDDSGWHAYLTTGLNYNWSSSGANMVDYSYAPTLRYVAQFGGTVAVELNGGWFAATASGYQHLFVRHNSTVYDIVNENGAAFSKTYTFNVKKGDVIEFISVIDPILSLEYKDLESAAAAVWRTDTTNFRRGARIDNINVTYTSVANVSTWDPATAVTSNSFGPSDAMVRFFQWYKTDGSIVAPGATLDATCVAKVNQALIDAGVISADDTLAVAYEKFCVYLKRNSQLSSVKNEWSFGNVKSDGTFEAFGYNVHYHNRSLLLAGGSTVAYTNADGMYYYTYSANWDMMMSDIMYSSTYGLLNKGVLMAGATAVTADNAATVTIGELSPIAWSTDVGNLTKYTHLTNGNSGFGYTSGSAFAGYGSNDQPGFRYTATVAGKLTISLDAMTVDGTYKWKIMKNGTFLQDAWQAAADDSVTEIQAALTAMGTIDVEVGDTITIVFDRDGGKTVKPTISATLVGAPMFSTTTALTINDAYGVKMSATPSAAGGVITAFIDGEWVEGTLSNGAYNFTLKDGINVSALTATVDPSAVWENCNPDGVAVSYQLKEVVNGHTVVSTVYSTNTNKMLSYYEASADARVATLAKDIRHLAIAANAALYHKGEGDFSSTEKNYIRGKSDAALTELKAAGALHSFTGEAGKYAIVGANVNLDNRLSVVILMAANEGGTLADLRDGGYYVEATNATAGTVKADVIRSVVVNGTEYMGVIVSVPISMWDQSFAYTIKDDKGNAVSKTLNYSVKAWCVSKYTGKDDSSMAGYVVRAMYNLGNSAAAYKASL